MGEVGVNRSQVNFTQIFETVFPYFLSIGMTYEQFWYKDPHLVKDYAKAEELRARKKNQELWLQGYYVYNAIGAFAEILPAFPKKGAKINPYLEEPVSLTEEEARRRQEEQRRKRAESIKERMIARSLAINAKRGETNERNNN